MRVYTTDELDRLGELAFPYIERQEVGGIELLLNVATYKTEDWYGYKGWRRRVATAERARGLLSKTHDHIHSLLREGDVVFDCGANEGYITVLIATWIGPKGKVLAFEPDPRNIPLIQENLRLNGIENVIIIDKVVSNRSGEKVFFSSEVVQQVPMGIELDTVRLDDYAQYRPQFIKIDVEGYELPLLQGARETLKHCQAIELELHLSQDTGIHMRKKFGFNPDDIYHILRDTGYQVLYHNKEVLDGEEPQGCVYCLKGDRS